MVIDYGDPRLSDRFWDKVHVVPELSCWIWVAARKMNSTTGNPTFTFERRVTTVLRVYFKVFFPEVDREKYIPRMGCGQVDCANPNHVIIVEKGTCMKGHKARKEKGGGCAECKHIWYLARRKGSGERRPSKNENVKTPTVESKSKSKNQLSVFGDRKPDKPWRPPGWTEQPKVSQWSASHRPKERMLELEHSG